MACSLAEAAFAQGITQIGWHCYRSNKASSATARKAGFAETGDYQVLYAWFDPVANLAVNGNVCLQQERYAEAVGWYERAFRTGEPPVWAFVNAACAHTMTGDLESALRRLWEAVERGFSDAEHLKGSKYLTRLHVRPEWQTIVSRLGATDG
jgi:hypothetical protein